MAYTDDMYLLQVSGSLPGGEVWSNTWCVQDTVGGNDVQDAVDALHQFYDDVLTAGGTNATVHAARCSVKNLGTGDRFDATWADVAGTASSNQMPDEVALRISLSGGGGTRGGPFLPPFIASEADNSGQLTTGRQSAIATALGDLNTALQAADFQLSIDKPTTSTIVPAATGRIGKTFDVIRKRRNKLAESYAMVTLGP